MTRYFFPLLLAISGQCFGQSSPGGPIQSPDLNLVKIHDAFWSPKLRIWDSITVNDVFDKLEGNYIPDQGELNDEKKATGRTRNVLVNFDAVARGEKNTGAHDGPPWYDGLLYETIRGAADLLTQYPNQALQQKIDRYIDHIAAAQAADPNGYLETYTTLTRPDKRWGTHGGDDKWQHDIYNGGMLVEAAIHYYKATGKTKLLVVAVKMANYMSSQMGPAPRLNVIPGHGGPEESLLKLYQLFKTEPALKKRLGPPVHEQAYYDLATYWITNRGNYGAPGSQYARNSDSSYNQDQSSVFQQTTIEGHAVRATLLATGITAVAIDNADSRYGEVARRYWDNMIGKRMFITGGEGAISEGERFGPDYFLPESAYLETCAAISAGFFSEKMNELKADGKYIDALERVLYNNFLSGIALDGQHYFYENPLKATEHTRWSWHGCPCCPPMILKMAGTLPRYIYSYDNNGIYVNLFIGSEADFSWKKQPLTITQTTRYPWDGAVAITVKTAKPTQLKIHVRIPGWAIGEENPYGLYHSNLAQKPVLSVNGQSVEVQPVNGYAIIDRVWQAGDNITLSLPMQPRVVAPIDSVPTLQGKISLASGPVVYALEETDNEDLSQLKISGTPAMQASFQPQLLNGVTTIKGSAYDASGKQRSFTAIPFYSLGNRTAGSLYEVWLPVIKSETVNPVARIIVDASTIENNIPSSMFGSCIEDVNHEIYGGLYAQLIMGESFEEPASGTNYKDWKKHGGYWAADREYNDGSVTIIPGRHTRRMVANNDIDVEPDGSAKLIYDKTIDDNTSFEGEMRFLQARGTGAGLLIRASNIGIGTDALTGYEIRLNRETQKIQLLKHRNDTRILAETNILYMPEGWNRLRIVCDQNHLSVFLNGQNAAALVYTDNDQPILHGYFGLATAGTPTSFRDIKNGIHRLDLTLPADQQISDRWDPIQTDSTQSRFTLTQHDAYNGLTAQVIQLDQAGKKTGIANRGLNRWGISLEKNATYTGSCYLHTGQGSLPVTIALESADGLRTYAGQMVKVSGNAWHEYSFSLTAASSDPNARLAIYIQQTGKLYIDQVSLFPNGSRLFKNLPMRADIAQAILAEGLTFMRYAGTMVNAPGYRFKKMIGPRADRPPYTGHWNEYASNGFGIPEFLQLCETARITPAFAINIEETAADAADMVDYLNGEPSTVWGKKRKADGHPNPYKARYIEIGNEEVLFEGDDAKTADHYIDRFLSLYQAIHARDTSIQLVISAWWRPRSANTEKIFRALNGKAAFWDYHVGGDDPESGKEVDQALTRMQSLFHQWDPATTMRCAIFEENGGLHNMQRALGHATNLNAVRRHGDFLLTSCPANALQPWLQNDNSWDQGQIFFTPDSVWGMPPYYVQQLAAANYLPLRVNDTTQGALDVTATRDQQGKILVLHIVNPTATAINADISIGNWSNRPHTIQWTTIAGALAAENLPGQSPAAMPIEETIQNKENNKLQHNCLPYSYNVVRLTLQ